MTVSNVRLPEEAVGKIEVTAFGQTLSWEGPITRIEQRREPVEVPSADQFREFRPGPLLDVVLTFDAEAVQREEG